MRFKLVAAVLSGLVYSSLGIVAVGLAANAPRGR